MLQMRLTMVRRPSFSHAVPGNRRLRYINWDSEIGCFICTACGTHSRLRGFNCLWSSTSTCASRIAVALLLRFHRDLWPMLQYILAL